MTFNLKLLQDFTLEERALHEVAKACWGNYSLPIVDCIVKRHREVVIIKVCEIFSSTLPNTLRDKLKNAVIRLQRGYREALACTGPYKYPPGIFIPNPLMAGPYSAKNFIDPSGHFDELAWAKHYVSDDKISVYSRFELACFFGFEELIRELWLPIKNDGSSRYLGDFYYIKNKYGFPVGFWTNQLENNFLVLYRYFNSEIFNLSGLRDAIDGRHEYAARFFWARCTDREKALFLDHITSDFQLWEKMVCFTKERNPGVLNFVYSLLPLERKKRAIIYMPRELYAEILSCLLISTFYKTVLKDILCTPLLLQYSDFLYILEILSKEMVEIPLLEFEELFLALWKHFHLGIPETAIFTPALRNLIVIKAEGLLSKIIQPLRHDDKLSLLGDRRFWNKGEYLWHGNYDLLLRFLIFFVIDLDPVTQTFSLKRESIIDLCYIIETNSLAMIRERHASAYLEIRKVVENIRESFEVLDDLLSQLDEIP